MSVVVENGVLCHPERYGLTPTFKWQALFDAATGDVVQLDDHTIIVIAENAPYIGIFSINLFTFAATKITVH